MMSRIIISILFACALISSAQAKTLLVFGDSLSAAYNLRQQDGWVSLLSQELKTSHPDIEVINASVSGETTQGGLARLPKLIRRYQPTWFILELGANDGLRGYPLNQAKDNLAKMVDLATQVGAQTLLVGNHLPSNYGRSYTNQFFNLYKELANDKTLEYLPFMLENVALNKELMLDDGLHPNTQGQKVVLKNIKQALMPMLEHP